MDEIQNEPTENTPGIQPSEPATEEQNLDQGTGTDNASPDEDSQEERIVFDDRQQAKVNELIGGKVAQTHKERQRADEAERKLADLQAQMPQAEAPAIPDVPNPEDFYSEPEKLKAAQDQRDEAIKNRATFDQQTAWDKSQLLNQAQQQAKVQAQKQHEVNVKYGQTAESFGIKSKQMAQEAAILGNSGLDFGVQDHLAQDPQGPLIVNFLAKNILELDKLRSMSPMQAAIHIATEIKPKLAGIKKTTSTPHPLDLDDGKGVPEKTDPRLAGVTYS